MGNRRYEHELDVDLKRAVGHFGDGPSRNSWDGLQTLYPDDIRRQWTADQKNEMLRRWDGSRDFLEVGQKYQEKPWYLLADVIIAYARDKHGLNGALDKDAVRK